MDLRQLEYLVAVADHGSFTAAADAIGVAQPSVSQGLRALENELGVALVDRLPRGAAPTAAGLALLPSARAALGDVRAGRAAVDAVRGLEGGTLDIVCLATLAAEPTGRLVGALRAAHPGVSVRIAQPESVDDVLERVRDGRSELGVTDLAGDLAGLETHELAVQDLVVLAPAGWPTTPLSRAALEGLPLVSAPAGTSTRRQLEEIYAEIGRTPQVVVETDHRDAVTSLVASGAGVALVPRPEVDPGADARVVVVELARPVRRRVGLVHRHNPLSPAGRAFLATVVPGLVSPGARPRARRRSAGR